MRARAVVVLVSGLLLAGGLATAAAQRAVPAKPIPSPVIPTAPTLPTITPTLPSLPVAPLPSPSPVSPSIPAAIPVDPCAGLNPPGYCTGEAPPPDGGGGSPQNSDLCQADPRPPWCGRPTAPATSSSN